MKNPSYTSSSIDVWGTATKFDVRNARLNQDIKIRTFWNDRVPPQGFQKSCLDVGQRLVVVKIRETFNADTIKLSLSFALDLGVE